MAAGTADGQPEKGDTNDVGHLGEDLVAADCQRLVAGVAADRTQAMEPGGNPQLVIVRLDLIAGELLQDEAIKWFVAVERVDDVITVAPGPGAQAIVLEALCLGE